MKRIIWIFFLLDGLLASELCKPIRDDEPMEMNWIPINNLRGPTSCYSENCQFLNHMGELKKIGQKNRSLILSLILDDHKIETLDSQIFLIYTKLMVLKINSRKLKSLETGSFEGAENLVFLSINGTAMETLENGTFSYLAKLKNLHFFYAPLKTLEVGAFRGLCQLRILEIQHHKIESLEPGIFDDLPRLQMLSLQDGELKILNTIFQKPANLQHTNLNKNQISKIFGMKNLRTKYLLIEENRLKNIFITSHTIFISAKNNTLDSLYCEADLKIVHFFAQNNQLSNFNCIDRMEKLKFLDLSYNNFTEIPGNLVERLGRLASFEMTGNDVEQLEDLMTFNPKFNINQGADELQAEN